MTISRSTCLPSKVFTRTLVLSPALQRFIRLLALILTVSLVAMTVGLAHAETFDRVAAKKRYVDWYGRFEADFRMFAQAVGTASAESLDKPRVNRIFAQSVVPDSRMAGMLLGLANRPNMMRGNQGDPPVGAHTYVMLRTLRSALPAGYGGAYTNKEPIPSDAGSFIWYLHVHSGETNSGVFRNPEVFNPYHLPPYGVMERNAYPFIVFCEIEGKLYAAGLSAEFVEVVDAMWNRQLY
jgi:hypothetical protein